MAAVSRAQDARPRRRTGPDPRVRLAKDGDVCPTGRECAFIFLCGWQTRCRHSRPPDAVAGSEYVKLLINRIAERNAVICVPERHRIEERFWIFVLELQVPGL